MTPQAKNARTAPERLEAVRQFVAGLPSSAGTDRRPGIPPWTILEEAKKGGRIDTLDMGVVWANDADCRTMGCLIGIATMLFPEEVENALDPDKDVASAVARTLGLDQEQAATLFYGREAVLAWSHLAELTAADVCRAIDRVREGARGAAIWQDLETRDGAEATA